MTNQEYIVKALQDDDCFDDGGATWECVVHYNIQCPYYSGDKRALCYKNENLINRENCVKCKAIWLEQEVEE